MSTYDNILALKEAPNDERLWERFYRELYPLVVGSIFRLCQGDKDSARDAAQEAFARFAEYRSLERVSNDEHALAFLRQIARRSIFDRFRKRLPLDESLEGLRDSPVQVDEATSAWLNEEARWERIHDLELLAEGLPPRDQLTLGMLFDGRPLDEIAIKQGVTYNSLVVRIHRMRRRLNRALVSPTDNAE